MSDIVTTSRCTQNATLAALNTSNPTYLASLISVASDAIQQYLHRDVIQQTYTEYYSGGIFKEQPLLLRQFPVTEIQRIACAQPGILVQNSGQTAQRATVETSNTGVSLNTVISAVAGQVSLPYATYPTCQSIAAAINAAGNGWQATVWSGTNGSYNLWPSADLRVQQGAVSCMNGGRYLEIYDEAPSIQEWGWGDGDDDWSGLPGAGSGTLSYSGWRLVPATGEVYFRPLRGLQNIRIDYTAGWAQASVPQSIQEATVQYIVYLFNAASVNYSSNKVQIGPYSETSPENLPGITGPIKMLLGPHRAADRIVNYG